MIGNSIEHRFFIQSLTALAKAIVSNLELMNRLEMGMKEDKADAHIEQLYWSPADRASISQTYVTGRFLNFRKLHPSLTDEALEHRLAWALAGIKQNNSELSEDALDDPARCFIPLLTSLAEVFLCEARDGSLRVRTAYLAEWQDLILVFPPLLICAAWMAQQPNSVHESISDREAFQRRVQNWLCDSTLPVDDDPLLDQLCRVDGLDETHMHFNGTTEAEKVWIDALRKHPETVNTISAVIKRENGLYAAIGNNVNRLLRQEDPALTPQTLRFRVEHAITLKSFLLEALPSAVKETADTLQNTEARYAIAVRNRHSESELSQTTAEAMQLVEIINYLTKGSASDTHGVAFLWYALIRAQFCRLLVQQVGQTGFDQFQYITFNELRETTEKSYAERFRQIERGIQQPVEFLEGRFAPKTTPKGTADRIKQILGGYLQFLDEGADGKSRKNLAQIYSSPKSIPNSLGDLLALVHSFENGSTGGTGEIIPKSERRLRLGLVAHFIKRTNQDERKRFSQANYLAPVCRDSQARREVDKAARALIVLMRETSGLAEMIRGVDAASNERHAGPEVFAQVFRRLRRAGIKSFTYHVGEDFVHMASGLRAMNEAIRYLDLSAGCRIGHGTAAGLIPEKWWKSIGGALIQPLEDRLDDLVFAWGTLLSKGVLLEKLPRLDLEIRRISMQIWQDPNVTPDLLLRAWQLRHIDPIISTYGDYDVDPDRDAEIQLFAKSKLKDPDAHALFLRRHGHGMSKEARQRSNTPTLVSREMDILDAQVLEALQIATLELLRERRMAIETLPSSNVRISIHESYDEHHSLNWLGFGNNLCPSSVVIGSDDPGIFATSLRTEYAHLLRALDADGAGIHGITTLEHMNKSSKRFRF